MSLWLKRFSLLAVLVLSQALYAGHAAYHVSGEQVDCQICLQASSGGAAVVCADSGPVLSACPAPAVSCRTLATAPSSFPASQPARAPPSYPV